MGLNVKYRVLGQKRPVTAKPPAAKPPAKPPAPPAKKPPVIKPYTGGAESSVGKRKTPLHLAMRTLQSDLICFDIFDTLILRPFGRPTDLFYVLEHKFEIPGFFNIRITSEREAREISFEQTGSREVTIYQIYAVIEQRTGLPIDEGVRVEYETELEFCFANPFMYRVYLALLAQGKKIIAVSNMYLPHDMIKGLLERCGYTQLDEVFVSCDYHCSKTTKGLYEVVKAHYPQHTKLMQIGDNYQADIVCAKESGLDAIFYKGVNDIGNQYRADGMSEVVRGAYAGIVNTTLHNGMGTYSPLFEYGFINGGLYVLGFCNWIHKKAKLYGIDKILFLSRDGDIYQKVFNMMFDDVPNEYVLWSRIITTKMNAQSDRNGFLLRFINAPAQSENITIAEVLESIDMPYTQEELNPYDLRDDDILTRENLKAMRTFLVDRWDTVVRVSHAGLEHTREYLLKIVGDSRKIAVVDVGWVASGPMSIKRFVEDEMKMDCSVHCLIAGSFSPEHVRPLVSLMNEHTESYILNRMYNRNLYDTHERITKSSGKLGQLFFEAFTQAEHPSFAEIDADGNYVFDVPEVENYHATAEIQSGIYTFCEKYIQIFGRYPFMYNISGYDAYLPFRNANKEMEFLFKLFENFSFKRYIGANAAKQRLVRVSEMRK